MKYIQTKVKKRTAEEEKKDTLPLVGAKEEADQPAGKKSSDRAMERLGGGVDGGPDKMRGAGEEIGEESSQIKR